MDKSTYGTAQFKVKFRTVELQVAPGATASSLGTLKKGAVVSVLADANPYYYKVSLGNGLEGYVYKPAGTLSGSIPTPAEKGTSNETKGTKAVRTTKETKTIKAATRETKAVKATSTSNGSIASLKVEKSSTASRSKTTASKGGLNALPSKTKSSSGVASSNSGGGVKSSSSDGQDLLITSAEIAVFDKPGLIGKQVSKLKRGAQVTMLTQDGFFFEVLLPGGTVGYIPCYSGRLG
ncbi:MAG: SH3 domain-containing protein [Chloroflexota bacterium]|nr:SH3 domain-containing protein [Chloroflexota bacterium]